MTCDERAIHPPASIRDQLSARLGEPSVVAVER